MEPIFNFFRGVGRFFGGTVEHGYEDGKSGLKAGAIGGAILGGVLLGLLGLLAGPIAVVGLAVVGAIAGALGGGYVAGMVGAGWGLATGGARRISKDVKIGHEAEMANSIYANQAYNQSVAEFMQVAKDNGLSSAQAAALVEEQTGRPARKTLAQFNNPLAEGKSETHHRDAVSGKGQKMPEKFKNLDRNEGAAVVAGGTGK